MKHFLLAVVLCLTVSACGQNSNNGSLSAQSATCTSVRVSDTACVPLVLQNNAGTASVSVTSNAGANTLQFEASGDGGATWVAMNGTPTNSTTGASSTTSTGTWRFAVSGLTNIRVRCSTFVSGTTYVVIQSSPTAASLGGGGGGTSLSPAGVNNDVVGVTGANQIGALDTTLFTYSSSTLSAPNLALSGNATVTGNESVSSSLFVGAGTPNEGTTGTDLNGTAEFVNTAGAVQLKACATSKRYCFLVVKESSCGGGTGCTTGNAWVQGAFTETDTFSNTAVVGNWFKGSTTAAKQIEDTGTANTSQCPTGVTCLGYAMTAGSGSQTVIRTAPVIGPNQGPVQTNGVVFVGTPGTAVSNTGSEVSIFEYKTDNTGIVNGTGVGSSVFSAVNQCLRVEILMAGPGVSTAYKFYYGGTSVATFTTATLATELVTTYVCTTTNTSTEAISTAPVTAGAQVFAPPGNGAVAVDGTVGQLIKFTATGASGSVTIKAVYITKMF